MVGGGGGGNGRGAAAAAVVALAAVFNLPQHPAMVIGALVCFGLRYMGIRRGWRLPVAGPRE